MNKVLIDSDIILDFFFDRKPFSEFATKILNLCESKKIIGFVTPITISNVYYILRKTAKHEIIIENLKKLLLIIDIVNINKESILASLNSQFGDFEDALQNFSTINEKDLSILLTRNLKDYKTSKLNVLTPEIYLKSKNFK